MENTNESNITNKNEEITLEDLQLDGLKIYQSPSLYRFTSDAVILANFVNAKPSDKVVDLGSGSGIISILVAHKNNLKNVTAVEIQTELANLAKKSIEYNNMQERIKVINCDMLDLLERKNKDNYELNDIDIVVCNPPYKKLGGWKQNINLSQKIARHEVAVNIENIIKIAKSLLKYGGKFYLVCDSDRTAEIIFKLKSNNLEPKTMFFTQSSSDKNSNLVLIKSVLGGKEGVKILKTIITNDKDGKYIEEIKKIKFE